MSLSKIQTAEEKEKKERRTRVIMAIFVTVLLGVSTAAYALMDTSSAEKKTYNGFTFIQTDSGWQVKKLGLITSYLPSDVENISVYGNPKIEDFSGNAYLVAMGNQEIMAANELLKTLNVNKANLACSAEDENESFCADLPIKSCSDASSGNNIIIFSRANESSVSYKDYCLIINGSEESFVKGTDRVIFGLYDIIA